MSVLKQINKIDRPKDLAGFIHGRLKQNNIDFKPIPVNILEDLFDTLFYASLHSEEGELIRVTVTVFEEANPQLKERKYEAGDKWRFISFEKPIPFTVANLVKLAKAADPWSSSLAVYFDEDNVLFIYGMIDQAIHSQSYINFETDRKPDQPGYFSATVNGIGNISVMTEYDLIATLKQDCLICEYVNVFQSGPVRELIRKLARSFKTEINNYLQENYPGIDPENWDGTRNIIVRNSISRIINQIKNYHHGGAILFSSTSENLDVKYKLKYDRLASAMSNMVKIKIVIDEMLDFELMQAFTAEQRDEYDRLVRKKRFAENELKGAIRFIASQSCVDGLVLFDYNLLVHGFGVVINSLEQPEHITLCSKPTVTKKSTKKIRTDKFGTRHRSMFAYCDAYPGSLGLIISQDGDVRAVTKVDDLLIMWDNIQTQKTVRSSFFRRNLIENQ